MNYGNGWMSDRLGGGIWLWTMIGALMVVLLVVLGYDNGPFIFGP